MLIAVVEEESGIAGEVIVHTDMPITEIREESHTPTSGAAIM